jgi:hypothetical protein
MNYLLCQCGSFRPALASCLCVATMLDRRLDDPPDRSVPDPLDRERRRCLESESCVERGNWDGVNRVKMVRFLFDANICEKVIWDLAFLKRSCSPERFCCIDLLGAMVKTKHVMAKKRRKPMREGGRDAKWLSTVHPGRRRAH